MTKETYRSRDLTTSPGRPHKSGGLTDKVTNLPSLFILGNECAVQHRNWTPLGQFTKPPWGHFVTSLPLSWIWNYKSCQGINWPATLALPLLTFSLALPWGPVQRPGTMYVCITFSYDAQILMTGNEVRQKVFIVHVFPTTLCLSKRLSQNSPISLEPHKRHFKKIDKKCLI